MARLPYLSKEDLPEEHRDLLSRDINLAKLYAHSPFGSKALATVGQWVRFECNLDPRLRELAILQIGYLTQTEYEWSHHIKIGREFGVSDSDIDAIYLETRGEKSDLDETAALTIKGAREITEHMEMSDETFRKLHAVLGDEGIVDLTIVTSYYNGVIRLLRNMKIDVEPEYEPYLKRFPLDR